MGRQPFPIAGSLDDALIAGVGQAVQGAVAQNGLVEEAEASPEFLRELLRARVSLPVAETRDRPLPRETSQTRCGNAKNIPERAKRQGRFLPYTSGNPTGGVR